MREEENGSVGELSTVCSQIVLKCLSLARIGRPDILWSVNKLSRAVTNWTKACDKRLARFDLLSYITHVNTGNVVLWETQHNNADQDCFKTLVQETLKTRSQQQEELCAFLEAIRVFQSVGCARNKLQFRTVQQNPKSSLDAGLRMDGISALDLWDLVIEAFHSSTNQTNKTTDVREPR